MLKIFIGFDQRQPIAYTVLAHSILDKSTKPVSITALCLNQLPLQRRGLTPFTFSRFLVPYLCDYQGWALFLDIDMLVNDDISKLFDLNNEIYAVMVSKNKVKFEWASAMLFNCAHPHNAVLTPDYIEKANDLHRIGWLNSEMIGSLPPEWNHLVGYDKPRQDAKLIHYTQGIPVFEETQDSELANEWMQEHRKINSAQSWETLMGNSVHAIKLSDGTLVPRYKVESPQ